MELTQPASAGDDVVYVNCYVDGLLVGDFITLNGATYEVVALAVPSGRRRLFQGFPITVRPGLTSAASSGDLVKVVRPPSPPSPPSVPPEVTKCEGCNNINGPGECWNTCGDAAGLCSKCDGTLGTPGACCQKGEADDPPECSWVPDTSFLYDGYHTCVLLPPGPPSLSPPPPPVRATKIWCQNSNEVCDADWWFEPSPNNRVMDGSAGKEMWCQGSNAICAIMDAEKVTAA